MSDHTAPHVLRLAPSYYFAERELTPRELQYDPVGGMEVQIAQTTEGLDELGVPQTVVVPRRPGMPRTRRVGALSHLRLLRLPLIPIRTRGKGYVGLLFSWAVAQVLWVLAQRLWRRGRPWSLVHVHCSERPWTFVVAALSAAVLRLPLVITIHCSAIATFRPQSPTERLTLPLARWAERLALRRADRVLVLTDRLGRIYRERGLVAAERLLVVPDGVRLDQFTPPPGRDLASGEDDPLVVYCGRFAPEKGWNDFVAAADLLIRQGEVNAVFHMYGDGNELERCRQNLARRGLTDRVRLAGYQDRATIAARLRAASVVVVPSHHEELGCTVLEALATGRAVVATDVGGLPEVIRHESTGLLVPARRPDRIAAAVTRLLTDPGLRRKLGEGGVLVAQRYGTVTVLRRLQELYLDMAGRTADAGARRVG